MLSTICVSTNSLNWLQYSQKDKKNTVTVVVQRMLLLMQLNLISNFSCISHACISINTVQ